MKGKVCLIVNFWLGDRRKMLPEYTQDKLHFLKQQIYFLEVYKHNLTKIVFNFNITPEQYQYIPEIFNLIPKQIQGAEVEINLRENYGISYGAFSDIFSKYKTKYDYYVFNEDDYVFSQDNWDIYLVNKHNSYPDCGYLCILSREPSKWFNYKKHAGCSIGIASTPNLLKLFKFCREKLPYPDKTLDDFKGDKDKTYRHFEEAQFDFTFNFLKLGLNIYDVRDDYRVIIDAGNLHNKDICVYFKDQHEDILVKPLKIINKKFSWFASTDIEFLPNYILLTPEEALYCYDNKLGYYEYRHYE
jgi:hypothetical protein